MMADTLDARARIEAERRHLVHELVRMGCRRSKLERLSVHELRDLKPRITASLMAAPSNR